MSSHKKAHPDPTGAEPKPKCCAGEEPCAQESCASSQCDASGCGCGGKAPEPAPQEEQDYYGQLLRLKAEFENYRKRVDRDKPQWERRGVEQLLARLLPLYDVLLSAHQQLARQGEALSKSGEGSAAAVELGRGLELIFKEFTKLFESEGVQVIACAGKPYDFNLHEVLGQVETDAHPEGTVVEELQRGYTLAGRVLRPAKVRIAKKPS
ncbi:MAG: nucleotide exchange factor GrpE [Elusimicrobiota bacterium]|jgi:molecular chaperone GrpE